MNNIRLYPVLELLDVFYGYKYGWLSKLFKVSSTIMLRPENRLGKAFNEKLSIKQYLTKRYGVPIKALNNLKVMLDHGIFMNEEDFKKNFHVHKTPESLIKIYDILRIDYGLAYDIPSRLHIEIAIKVAISKLLHSPLNNKILKAVHSSMKLYVNKLAEVLSTYVKINKSLLEKPHGIRAIKLKMYKLIYQTRKEFSDLYDTLHALSEASVRETIKNLEKQLQFKDNKKTFKLIPVVQGIYREHTHECLINIIDLLMSYNEFSLENDKVYLYIAIGTGGRILSRVEANMINELMLLGRNYAKKLSANIRFHILGWSSPKIAKKLKISLVYSSDSLSVRRRAVEGKIYIIDNNEIRLVNVSEIRSSQWNCPCPVCQDPILQLFVLDPSSKRKNDARIVHNLWVIRQYIRKLLRGT